MFSFDGIMSDSRLNLALFFLFIISICLDMWNIFCKMDHKIPPEIVSFIRVPNN